MSANASKRVAITGLGIITAIGESIPAFREELLNGKCGIGTVSLFDTTGFPCLVAAEIKNRNLKALFEPREIKRVSRCDLLGLIAAKEALLVAGLKLEKFDGSRVGVVLGAGAGGMLSWERYRRTLWSRERNPRPSLILPTAHCTLTDLIASHYKLTGFRSTISTACSSSATSIGYGFDLIRSGAQDIVVTGGSESLSELTFAGFNSLRLMDPDYCRPFDKNRRGLSLGEGAGIIILENYGLAKERGATIYAEVLGYAINSDAFHMTSPDPEAVGMSKVMAKALERSNVDVDQLDYINAHGTATQINDQMETKAIKRVFGEKRARDLPISSTKSMVGHCLGAAGAIEAIATILALYGQFLPPTIHLEEPDPDCELDYVANHSRSQEITIALSNSFAFGGNNTTVVFGRDQILKKN